MGMETGNSFYRRTDASSRHLLTAEGIGPYTFDRPLGSGVSGIAFLAHESESGSDMGTVVKVLHGDTPSGPAEEINTHRALHLAEVPQIVPYVDDGIAALHGVDHPSEFPYLAMDYASGGSLSATMQRERIGESDAVSIVEQVGRGLAGAHELGFVHRDVTPNNIFLSGPIPEDADAPLPDVWVGDWGSGGRYVPGSSNESYTKTAGYTPPEQYRGEYTPRGDQYGLAAVFGHMLVDRPILPTEEAAYSALMQSPDFDEEVRVRVKDEVPPQFQTPIRTAMAAEPGNRYASVSAFVADVRARHEQFFEDMHKQQGVIIDLK